MSVTISGSGQIIKQVVQTALTSVVTVASSPGSFVSVTGASVSITPTNANNKILVTYTAGTSCDAGGLYAAILRVTRNGTAIGVGNARGSTLQATSQCGSPHYNYVVPHTWTYLDSPATTSTLTYQLQMCSEQGVTTYIGGSAGASGPYTSSIPTLITVYEVAYA